MAHPSATEGLKLTFRVFALKLLSSLEYILVEKVIIPLEFYNILCHYGRVHVHPCVLDCWSTVLREIKVFLMRIKPMTSRMFGCVVTTVLLEMTQTRSTL
jgi:hypothetical protein